jgi:regulator of protease activity HflC (stomatin/prohibitin superfamily)
MSELIGIGVVAVIVIFFFSRSFRLIGPSQVGLVVKRFGKRLGEDQPIAFNGEAGYQARLLMPGLRFKLWPIFGVAKYPWVQVPAGEIGVVLAQIGDPLPIGAKSAQYNTLFGNFTDLDAFNANGGQKGVQRPVLSPGSVAPIHPVAFLVMTETRVYGLPVTTEFNGREMDSGSFGLHQGDLTVTQIRPSQQGDVVGIVTTLEGSPLPSGDIAGRLGGWADVLALESTRKTEEAARKATANADDPQEIQQAAAMLESDTRRSEDADVVQLMLGSKNELHNNFQDFQKFLDAGGHIGLQHDVLQYGAFNLNPFLVRVELVPMLVVAQGQVAVVKSYVGLPTEDTSGSDFKFGSIVQPGHRGIWREPLRTGKYAINPRVYEAQIVPTSILTLNWATANSAAHDLDKGLSSIDAKSTEGFVFNIDLQVQIHVPDTMAPMVISMVGTMANLVNEVLQSAVGNYFRNSLQALPAVEFIQTRAKVQAAAEIYITGYLAGYKVETKGVYIQDVIFPQQIVDVLTSREIANQEKTTYAEQKNAQDVRIDLERSRGTADMQVQLATATVSVDIKKAEAAARIAEAEGVAGYTERTGQAEGVKAAAIGTGEGEAIKAKGLAAASAYEAQVVAIGPKATAAIAIADAIGAGDVKIVPDILVEGGGGGALSGLVAQIMGGMQGWSATGDAAALGAGETTAATGDVVVTDGAGPAAGLDSMFSADAKPAKGATK